MNSTHLLNITKTLETLAFAGICVEKFGFTKKNPLNIQKDVLRKICREVGVSAVYNPRNA